MSMCQCGVDITGFINPAIYSAPFRFAFNDITTGGNQGCGTSPSSLMLSSSRHLVVATGTPGFTATKGWDPVRVVEQTSNQSDPGLTGYGSWNSEL